jgi:hypothetical protein
MKLILSIILAITFVGCASMQPKPPEVWKRSNLYLNVPVTETNKDGVVEVKEWKYYPTEMEETTHLIRPIIQEKK